jgi:hypothetical protein
MRNPLQSGVMRAFGVAVAIGAMLIASTPASSASAAPATPAAATDSAAHASAQAVNLALADGELTLGVSPDGGTKADNDGNDPVYPVKNTPLVSQLQGQSFLTAGSLSELAEADIDGSSYACAGIGAPGAGVAAGDQGQTCTLTGSSTDGVGIDLAQIPGVGTLLSPIASVTLTAGALLANAYDDNGQHGTGSISDLKVNVALLGGLLPPFSVPVTVPAGVNQPLLPAIVDALSNYAGDPLNLLDPLITLLTNTISAVATLTVNYQDTAGGVLTVSALHVSLLGDAVGSADLAKVTVGPNIVPTECDSTFTDVASSNPFCQDIRWLHIAGITKGYGDGTVYKPVWTTSREWMAAFLFRFANETAPDPTCTTAPFTDVDVDSRFCGDIQWLKDQGIADGFTDGTFHPHDPIGRQAVAQFVYRLTQGQDAPACTEQPFPDVAVDSPFCGAIAWFKAQGISEGYTGGMFQPTTSVTRQVMAAWIHRYSTMFARPSVA